MKWQFVMVTSFKGHIVPEHMTSLLVSDLLNREVEEGTGPICIDDLKDIDNAGMDLPGMVSMDRTWETIDVDGLKFEIPSQDFSHFYHRFKTAPLRSFSDGTPYHKVHSWINCIVVSPEQLVHILRKMEEMLPAANWRGEIDDRNIDEAKRALEKKGLLFRPTVAAVDPGKLN